MILIKLVYTNLVFVYKMLAINMTTFLYLSSYLFELSTKIICHVIIDFSGSELEILSISRYFNLAYLKIK